RGRRAHLGRGNGSFVVALVHHLGVNYFLLILGGATGGAVGRALLGLRRRVDLLGDLLHRPGQGVGLGADLLRALRGERLARLLDRRLDLLLGGGVDFVARVLERFLGLVGGVLGEVARLGQLALLAVLLGVRLGVGDHPLDFLLGEAGARFDLDLLLL